MQKRPHAGETKRTTTGTEKTPERGWLPATGCSGEQPSSSPRGGNNSPSEEMAPRGAAGPASPSPPQTQLEGERKGVASLDHPRAPLPQGARPRLQPPGERQARHRTPGRAGAGCHWLPSPSPATMAGRSLPSMTVTAAADRASQVRRLHSPGHRQPLLPRAEGAEPEDRPGPPPITPVPGLRKSGYLARGWGENTAQRRKRRKKTVASGPERFGKFGRLVPHWVTAARCARAPGSRRRSLTAPHPPVERMRGSGEGACTARAGSPRARARVPSRDRWGPSTWRVT